MKKPFIPSILIMFAFLFASCGGSVSQSCHVVVNNTSKSTQHIYITPKSGDVKDEIEDYISPATKEEYELKSPGKYRLSAFDQDNRLNSNSIDFSVEVNQTKRIVIKNGGHIEEY